MGVYGDEKASVVAGLRNEIDQKTKRLKEMEEEIERLRRRFDRSVQRRRAFLTFGGSALILSGGLGTMVYLFRNGWISVAAALLVIVCALLLLTMAAWAQVDS